MSQAAHANAPQPPPHDEDGSAEAKSGVGEVLPRKFGKYTLLRKLAVGGMAELFLALHRSMAGFEKLVVIKRILPEMSKDQGFVTMLLQEARIAATFSHPNIVTIFDVGAVDKTYFIAMEHIHGEDLRSIVRAMKPKSVTEFPLEHAIAIALGVAAGLSYAHEKKDLNGQALNIVHRDISPQNVLVTFTGDVKIVDFGIAKAARAAGDERPEVVLAPDYKPKDPEHHTRVGQLKGKVPYMSPEQARGETIDGRSDIFALGVMLFELSTGRRLFRGPNEFETLKMITEGEYPMPSAINPRISAALEAVIMKALAKDVSQRYQTARELQADLEAVVRSEQIAVSTLSLASWMQMLFDEKLAAQREALLEGKQLADVIAASEPDQYTQAGTSIGSMGSMPSPPSRKPWVFAGVAVLALGSLVGFNYLRQERQRAAAAAELRAAHSGTIELHSVPEGASIWLNGAPTAFRTPHTLTDLPTGPDVRLSVRLTADGYAPYTEDVALAQHYARATVQAQLNRARADAYAVLEVTTTPRGATVIVDGRRIPGTTPLTVPELAADVEHSVVVQHPDTTEEHFTFFGRAGQVERRPLALRERPLEPDEAWLNVTSDPPGAVLHVGNRVVDTGSPFHVRVRAREVLHLAFSAPGYEPEARSVRARPGETMALGSVHLDHDHSHGSSSAGAHDSPSQNADHTPGSLRIGARPWCNVTVDGRARGQSPVDVSSLPPGGHTVVCTNPTLGTRTQRVNVQPGAQAVVRFSFQ